MSKTINTSGKPDTINVQGFDSVANAWVPETMYLASYNTSHDPDTLKEFDYNFASFPALPSFTTVYYYQSYTNTLETNPVGTIKDDAVVYPNPVKDQFTIARLNVTIGTTVSLSIINTSGQIISRQTMTWQGQAQIVTQYLVPGVYWVIATDNSGNELHRQAIVKN
jgi:hypothetical protein